MKKIILLTFICIMAISFSACSKEGTDETVKEIENGNTEVEETEEDKETEEDTDAENEVEEALTFEEIITKMYAESGLEFPGTAFSELNKENQAYMLGVDTFEFVSGIVSEPMISSQAHSIVLFSVEEGSDIEAIKADIKANVDGYKWICVGVEDENILVENVGNTIILIMDAESIVLMDAFLSIVE